MIVPAILAGLVLGFLGSFHCVGMCGPLALALPVHHLQGGQKSLAHLLYNLGRVITYSILGLFFGMVGRGFYLAGWQQLFSIFVGSSILLLSVLQQTINKNYQPVWLEAFSRQVQKRILYFLKQQSYGGYLLMGMANGLLPCGMVYMAIAAALVTGNAGQSALLMMGFGMATLPAMLLLGIVGSRISLPLRNRIRQFTPFIVIAMACLLILRGMNLGIPFVSPLMEKQITEKVICH
jgi:uncharacterized protein